MITWSRALSSASHRHRQDRLTCGSVKAGEQFDPGASLTPGINPPAAEGTGHFDVFFARQGDFEPGTVTTVAVDTKSLKGTSTRVSITACTSTPTRAPVVVHPLLSDADGSTDNTGDVTTNLGVTTAFSSWPTSRRRKPC